MSSGVSVARGFSAWLGGGFLRPAWLLRSNLALRIGPLEQIALRFLRRRLGPGLVLGFPLDPGGDEGNRPAGIDESDGGYEVREIAGSGDGQRRLFRVDAFDLKVIAAGKQILPRMGDADANGPVRDRVHPVDFMAALMGRIAANRLVL